MKKGDRIFVDESCRLPHSMDGTGLIVSSQGVAGVVNEVLNKSPRSEFMTLLLFTPDNCTGEYTVHEKYATLIEDGKCPSCNGCGNVMKYRPNGAEFPIECYRCHGSGEELMDQPPDSLGFTVTTEGVETWQG